MKSQFHVLFCFLPSDFQSSNHNYQCFLFLVSFELLPQFCQVDLNHNLPGERYNSIFASDSSVTPCKLAVDDSLTIPFKVKIMLPVTSLLFLMFVWVPLELKWIVDIVNSRSRLVSKGMYNFLGRSSCNSQCLVWEWRSIPENLSNFIVCVCFSLQLNLFMKISFNSQRPMWSPKSIF